jgi:hypothetical protein
LADARHQPERTYNVRFSKIVSTAVLAAGMFALSAPAARAQEALSLGGGYQYSHISFSEGDGVNTNGFFIDFTGSLPTKTGAFSWAWTGEFTGNYAEDGHAYTYLGGARGSWEMSQAVKPFLTLEIGGITEAGDEGGDSSSAFLFDIGGGVRIPLSGQKFNVLLKLDYLRAFYGDNEGGGQNIFRLGVGASIPIR